MHTLKPSSSDTKLPSSDLLQDGLRIGHPGAGHCLREADEASGSDVGRRLMRGGAQVCVGGADAQVRGEVWAAHQLATAGPICGQTAASGLQPYVLRIWEITAKVLLPGF